MKQGVLGIGVQPSEVIELRNIDYKQFTRLFETVKGRIETNWQQ